MGKASIHNCCFNKLLSFLLIVVICIFTLCIFYEIKNRQLVCYEEEYFENRNELDSCKAHDCENSEKSFKSNLNPIKTIVQKTVYVYPILLISYLIVFIVTIIVLLVIFVKDDSCLKLAKLDELHEVKNIIVNGNFNDSIDKTTETTHCPISKTNPTIYEKTKSNKADLLKHYMTCVTEL